MGSVAAHSPVLRARSTSGWRALQLGAFAFGGLAVVLLFVAVLERIIYAGDVMPGVDVAGRRSRPQGRGRRLRRDRPRSPRGSRPNRCVRRSATSRSSPIPSVLKVDVDEAATLRAARQAGRSGNPIDQTLGTVLRRFRDDEVPLRARLQRVRADRHARRLGASGCGRRRRGQAPVLGHAGRGGPAAAGHRHHPRRCRTPPRRRSLRPDPCAHRAARRRRRAQDQYRGSRSGCRPRPRAAHRDPPAGNGRGHPHDRPGTTRDRARDAHRRSPARAHDRPRQAARRARARTLGVRARAGRRVVRDHGGEHRQRRALGRRATGRPGRGGRPDPGRQPAGDRVGGRVGSRARHRVGARASASRNRCRRSQLVTTRARNA